MAVRLNNRAYEHAQQLIKDGKVVLDDRDDWSEHQPSAQQENDYKFPYGDFERVHRCGVLSAESRAGQYKHDDIKSAAAHLHGMLEALG